MSNVEELALFAREEQAMRAWIQKHAEFFDPVLLASLRAIRARATRAPAQTNSNSAAGSSETVPPLLLRLAVFGLSANPPHLGHVQIADQMRAHKPAYDALLVLPVCRHMYASKAHVTDEVSFDDRVHMCKLAFAEAGAGAGRRGDEDACPVHVLSVEQLALHCAAAAAATPGAATAAGIPVGTGTAYVLRFLSALLTVLPLPPSCAAAATAAAAAAAAAGISGEYADGTGAGIAGSALSAAPPPPLHVQYSLVLGEDTALDLLRGKWQHSQYLLLQCMQLHVFQRSAGGGSGGEVAGQEECGCTSQQAAQELLSQCTVLTPAQLQQIKPPVLHVLRTAGATSLSLSSTAIRWLLRNLPCTNSEASPFFEQLADFMPPSVLRFIMQKCLYKEV